jgi:hypothetical protein
MFTFTISRRSAMLIAIAVLLTVPGTALAVHRFADVTEGATHAEGIEWLADAGVTTGCDKDHYCPDQYVTRAQMATFLCRISGNCGTGPSIDAATLAGMDPATFVREGDPVGDADTLDGLDSVDFLVATDPVDAATLDGVDSNGFLRTTDQAVDSDKVDGIDADGFLKHGPIELSSNVWQVSSDSNLEVRHQFAPVLTGPESDAAYNFPTLPASVDGNTFSISEATVCFDGDATTGVIEVALWVLEADGDFITQAIDSTDWYAPACVTVILETPVSLAQGRSATLGIEVDVNDTFVAIFSTSWTIIPTAAGHL